MVSDLEIFAVCAEVNGNERQPDDACGVHGECDVLGFIEVLRDVAGLERVDSAQRDEQHVVQQRHDDGDVGRLAAKDDRSTVRVRVGRVREVHYDPSGRSDSLDSDQAEADGQLGSWTGVAWPLHHGLEAAVEDT